MTDQQNSQPKKLNKFQVLFHPENRVTTFMAIAVLALVVIGIVVFDKYFGASNVSTAVQVSGVNTKDMEIEADAKKSEHYKDSVRQENAEKYEAARANPTGVAIPFTFSEDEPPATEGDINACECKIDDEQLLEQIRRLGGGILGGKINPKRIGRSDIYISETGKLLTGNGESILWKAQDVFMDDQGQLIDKNGSPILDDDGGPLFIGKTGQILDKAGSTVRLKGRLTTESGRVFGSDGKLVTEADGMRRVAECDIFITKDGQLVTADGKGLKFAGNDVFRGEQGNLVNLENQAVVYGKSKLHLLHSGSFTDEDGKVIESAALLFSYDGIVLDSSCLLQGELHDFQRIGESDIFKTPTGELVGENGKPIHHKKEDVRLDKEAYLYEEDGRRVLNSKNLSVLINEKGNLVHEDEKLISDPALLTTYEGVAIGPDGKLVTKNGNMRQLGESDIYVGADGLLLDKEGKPLQYNGKNVRVNEDGMLIDESGNPVLDKNGKPVFLNKNGEFVNSEGEHLDETGILTNSDGVIISSDGKIIDPNSGMEALLDENGEPILYNGQRVYRDKDGRLVDINGKPIKSSDGRTVYMDDEGKLVDEDGRIIDEPLLTDKDGNTVDTKRIIRQRLDGLSKVGESDIYVASDGLLVGSDGKALLYNGKKVRLGKDGALLDEDGNPVLDSNGNPVYLDENGNIVDANGNIVTETGILTTGDGVLINKDGKIVSKDDIKQYGNSDLFSTVDGKLVDKSGKSIKYNGKDVVVGEDGALYTIDGRPVTDSKGRKVYLDKDGNLVDKNGKKISETGILENSDGVLIGADGELIDKSGKLTEIGDTGLYRTDDGIIVDKNGKRVQVDGQSAKVDEQGRLLNRFGRTIRIAGKDVYVSADGTLVDKDGNPILNKDGLAMHLDSNGNIVDEDGNLLSQEGARLTKRDPLDKPSKISKPTVSTKSNPKTQSSQDTRKVNDGAALPFEPGMTVDPTDKKSLDRIQARYDAIKANMNNSFQKAITVQNRPRNISITPIGGNRDSGLSPEELEIVKAERAARTEDSIVTISNGGAGSSGASITKDGKELIVGATEVLYAVLESTVNSDYPGPILVSIAAKSTNPLNNARAIGQFKRFEDRVVIEFNTVKLNDGRTIELKGVAIDPNTSFTAMADHVDRHLLYRYGGLFLSKLIEGWSSAIIASTERVEEVNVGGSTTTNAGIDKDDIPLVAMGDVGEAFSEEFKKGFDRPPTVTVYQGAEIGIFIMEDVFAEPLPSRKRNVAVPVN